ncbi:MAG: DNA alkylation repair protein [Candidatus Kerfeldbacteria bacterium]|nr:DNA alkylation repair protein [Candidatus Kerfeldbacteria bacterium]
MIKAIKSQLHTMANPQKAIFLQRFFRTAPGEYAAGDKFLGITVPQQRQIAKQFYQLSVADLTKLLRSPWHEYRLTALIIAVWQYQHTTVHKQQALAKWYLANRRWINNWDLVDTSAPYILGQYLFTRNKTILYRLAKGTSLWNRRLAIISTQYFIRQQHYSDTLHLAKILLHDDHDLIHKAVGWMLREVGKRDQIILVKFLDQHYHTMPRTMLRYAIEKLSSRQRRQYLS